MVNLHISDELKRRSFLPTNANISSAHQATLCLHSWFAEMSADELRRRSHHIKTYRQNNTLQDAIDTLNCGKRTSFFMWITTGQSIFLVGCTRYLCFNMAWLSVCTGTHQLTERYITNKYTYQTKDTTREHLFKNVYWKQWRQMFQRNWQITFWFGFVNS